MADGEFQIIRQSLMSFFQDMHVRVRIKVTEKPEGIPLILQMHFINLCVH